MDYFEKIAALLNGKGEAAFGYGDRYIYIQERVEGGYEADIYNSRADYQFELEPLDGGIFKGEIAIEALDFFTEGLF